MSNGNNDNVRHIGRAAGVCTSQLKKLVKEAENGNLEGYALCAAYKNRGYDVTADGSFNHNPTFAIGTLMVLVYKLLRQAAKDEIP